jgi:small subunit ribosomal protein S18
MADASGKRKKADRDRRFGASTGRARFVIKRERNYYREERRMKKQAEKPSTPERRRKPFLKRKVCRFCTDKKLEIDYKNPKILRFFITERGKIIPRRISGNCAKHQRQITIAIKRARNIALLPFTTVTK